MKPLTEVQFKTIKNWLKIRIAHVYEFKETIESFDETFGHPFKFAPDDEDEPGELILSIEGEEIARAVPFKYDADNVERRKVAQLVEDFKSEMKQLHENLLDVKIRDAINGGFHYAAKDGSITEPIFDVDQAVENVIGLINNITK